MAVSFDSVSRRHAVAEQVGKQEVDLHGRVVDQSCAILAGCLHVGVVFSSRGVGVLVCAALSILFFPRLSSVRNLNPSPSKLYPCSSALERAAADKLAYAD